MNVGEIVREAKKLLKTGDLSAYADVIERIAGCSHDLALEQAHKVHRRNTLAEREYRTKELYVGITRTAIALKIGVPDLLTELFQIYYDSTYKE